jgi:hypothetical protein
MWRTSSTRLALNIAALAAEMAARVAVPEGTETSSWLEATGEAADTKVTCTHCARIRAEWSRQCWPRTLRHHLMEWPKTIVTSSILHCTYAELAAAVAAAVSNGKAAVKTLLTQPHGLIEGPPCAARVPRYRSPLILWLTSRQLILWHVVPLTAPLMQAQCVMP